MYTFFDQPVYDLLIEVPCINAIGTEHFVIEQVIEVLGAIRISQDLLTLFWSELD